jgi:RimJ/RimL family protein N-acetyltransferase
VSTRLETERLVIRTFEQRDAGPWIALVNDPEVTRFLPPTPEATSETFERGLQARLEMEHQYGHAMWAVDNKRTGMFIGQCGLRPVDEHGPEIDLAYHFTKVSWNKGYTTEAVVAVLGHGLGTLRLDGVMAVAMPDNVGSWRVMEKAGMRYDGLASYYGLDGLKKYLAVRGEWTAPAKHTP